MLAEEKVFKTPEAVPEYRQDPLTGQTVIIAEERAHRPHQFDIEENESNAGSYRDICPFCEGNEAMTPGEVAAFRPPDSLPDTPGWTVRTVPNKYPAVLRDDADFPDRDAFRRRYGAFCDAGDPMRASDADVPVPGLGNHEVVVDTPRHVLSLSDMTGDEIAGMFRMYAERLRALRAEGRWAYVQVFKNVGAAAGASLPHSHSQLIAMPFVPPALARSIRRADDYRHAAKHFRDSSGCFFCDRLKLERREGVRTIEETEHFLVLCPFVSRFSAEIEIYPNTHEPCFESMRDEAVYRELAGTVRRTIIRLERAVSWMKGRLAYNLVLHTSPFELPPEGRVDFHWRLSVLPSLARAAGFEWGTGLHINPISPEQAAERLRSIDPDVQ